MKLSRLESTTQSHSRDSVERAEQAGAQQIRRVEALEGIEGDKERSLQQERAEVEALAIGDFSGAGYLQTCLLATSPKITRLYIHKE